MSRRDAIQTIDTLLEEEERREKLRHDLVTSARSKKEREILRGIVEVERAEAAKRIIELSQNDNPIWRKL